MQLLHRSGSSFCLVQILCPLHGFEIQSNLPNATQNIHGVCLAEDKNLEKRSCAVHEQAIPVQIS